MLVDAGVGTATEIEEVARNETSLGLFLRSLVGLDRAAAKRAFAGFIETRHLSASQLDFVNLIVDHLTQCGWMRPEQLYSSPFTDQFVYGPNAVFVEQPTMQALVAALESVRRNAMGAWGSESRRPPHCRPRPGIRGQHRARLQVAQGVTFTKLARMFHRRSDFVVLGVPVRFGGHCGGVRAGSGPGCGDRGGLVASDSPHRTQFGRSSTDLQSAQPGNRLFAAPSFRLSSAAPPRPARTPAARGSRYSSTPPRAAR